MPFWIALSCFALILFVWSIRSCSRDKATELVKTIYSRMISRPPREVLSELSKEGVLSATAERDLLSHFTKAGRVTHYQVSKVLAELNGNPEVEVIVTRSSGLYREVFEVDRYGSHIFHFGF